MNNFILKMSNKRGYILIIALIVMVAVTLVAGIYLNTSSTERILGVKDYHEKQAFWLAEAGLQHCIYKLETDTPTGFRDSLPQTVGPIDLTIGTYEGDVSSSGTFYTTISTGTTDKGEVTKTIKQTIEIP